ncbi:MAG: aspartate carbamoyltransferase [Oscillospiraceae bacterium]|nr:aspartate carbamoyltransferase [Oscillospiraceae bacterium]
MLKGKNLIYPTDFTAEQLEDLFCLADRIIARPDQYAHSCSGKILATLFFEPSTRTRLSFEAAMERLGGKVLGFADSASSSATKGESIADTIRMISCYADIAAIRHPAEGAAHVAALHSFIPVINAGDGGHQHPTQTLTDLYTIRAKKGRFHNLTVGLCGDLKYGRTVHSLIHAMCRYESIHFVLISPPELQAPDYVIREIEAASGCSYSVNPDLDSAIRQVDILYMTRVQRERFASQEEYLRLKDSYILDIQKMKNAKEDMVVLHPMPIVNEITGAVDEDSRACYFVQAQYGMYVRMALILRLLGAEEEGGPTICGGRMFEKTCQNPRPNGTIHCQNPKCVSNLDLTLPIRVKDGGKVCEYCDAAIEE